MSDEWYVKRNRHANRPTLYREFIQNHNSHGMISKTSAGYLHAGLFVACCGVSSVFDYSTHFTAHSKPGVTLPRLAYVKICEYKFPTLPYFDLPPPFKYRHKFRWKTVAPYRGVTVLYFNTVLECSIWKYFYTIAVSKFVYFDGVRCCQTIFIVYENPLCVTAWIISSSFSVISCE